MQSHHSDIINCKKPKRHSNMALPQTLRHSSSAYHKYPTSVPTTTTWLSSLLLLISIMIVPSHCASSQIRTNSDDSYCIVVTGTSQSGVAVDHIIQNVAAQSFTNWKMVIFIPITTGVRPLRSSKVLDNRIKLITSNGNTGKDFY
jgi:hypothetical protein